MSTTYRVKSAEASPQVFAAADPVGRSNALELALLNSVRRADTAAESPLPDGGQGRMPRHRPRLKGSGRGRYSIAGGSSARAAKSRQARRDA